MLAIIWSMNCHFRQVHRGSLQQEQLTYLHSLHRTRLDSGRGKKICGASHYCWPNLKIRVPLWSCQVHLIWYILGPLLKPGWQNSALPWWNEAMQEDEKPNLKTRVPLRLIQSNTLQVKSRSVEFTRNCISCFILQCGCRVALENLFPHWLSFSTTTTIEIIQSLNQPKHSQT